MFGVLSPFALRRGHGVSAAEGGHFPRHVMANIPRPGRAYLACGGKPPERRKISRLPAVRQKRRLQMLRKKLPIFVLCARIADNGKRRLRRVEDPPRQLKNIIPRYAAG